MKAGKKNNSDLVTITGILVEKSFGVGSKSEHTAIGIETSKGWVKLKRMGANPFHDPELKKMLGQKVSATGVINDYLFLARTIQPEP